MPQKAQSTKKNRQKKAAKPARAYGSYLNNPPEKPLAG
jgi:hypothetical protein